MSGFPSRPPGDSEASRGQLKQGDSEFSATEWNRHVDAANRVLGQQALGTPHNPRLPLAFDTNLLTVKNNSGADRRRGEVLEFSGSPLTDYSAGELWLGGFIPMLANAFGVLLNPIPAGAFGNRDCQTNGCCLGLVNVTNETHKFARVQAGNCVLQSGTYGPVRILHKPGGLGEKTCGLMLNVPIA